MSLTPVHPRDPCLTQSLCTARPVHGSALLRRRPARLCQPTLILLEQSSGRQLACMVLHASSGCPAYAACAKLLRANWCVCVVTDTSPPGRRYTLLARPVAPCQHARSPCAAGPAGVCPCSGRLACAGLGLRCLQTEGRPHTSPHPSAEHAAFLMSALMHASLTCCPVDASSRGQPMLQLACPVGMQRLTAADPKAVYMPL